MSIKIIVICIIWLLAVTGHIILLKDIKKDIKDINKNTKERIKNVR